MTDATGQLAGFGIYPGGITGGHYGYDNNGNITSDPFKNITTTFNVLNKTDVITMNAVAGQSIAYIYDASGNMIRKIANSGTATTTTDYIDGFVYVNSTLSYFPMPEGRMVNEGGHLKPQYVVTDQQGNARITFDNTGPNNTAKVIQENSYYGFGMVMPGSAVSLPIPPNKNLYNGGSEVQDDFGGLPGLMQTFYRNYDAALGRWTGVDPQADAVESLSTYQYAGNNPIMGNDPLGNKATEAVYNDLYNSNLGTAYQLGMRGATDVANSEALWTDPDYIEYLNDLGGGNGAAAQDAAKGFQRGVWETDLSAKPTDYSQAARQSVAFDNLVVYGSSSPQQAYQAMGFTDVGYSSGYIGKNGIANITWHSVLVPNDQNGPGPGVRASDAWFLANGWKEAPWYGNFLGPGPDGDPYLLKGPDGKQLQPIDMLDAAARRHDNSYNLLKTGGVYGALFVDKVYAADLKLAKEAGLIIDLATHNINDVITGKPISQMELTWADRVYVAFYGLGGLKALGMWLTGK